MGTKSIRLLRRLESVRGLMVAACVLMWAHGASALNVISIDFVGGGFGGTPSNLAATDVAGVFAVPSWNNVAQNLATGTVFNLLDNLKTPTSASVNWACDNTWSTTNLESTPDFKMMKGYLDNPSHDTTVSVSGIPYASYDVYVYFNDDNTTTGTTGSYTIGGTTIFGRDNGVLFNGTYVQAAGTNSTDTNAIGNYMVFHAVTGSNFTLTAHSINTRAPVNGLQIVSPAGFAATNQAVVFGWGDNEFGEITPPLGLSNVVAISAGGDFSINTTPKNFSLALTRDQKVVAWGDNTFGQTNVPSGLSNVTAIAAGGYHSLALKADGTIVAWGDNSYGQINIPAGLNNVAAIAASALHSMALKSNGTVVAWGFNVRGATNVPPGLSGVVAIAAGGHYFGDFSLALKSNGTVVAWGDNSYGATNVPSGLSNVIAIAAGGDFSTVLKADHTVVSFGDGYGYNYGETDVPDGLSNVVAIAAGSYSSLALKNDGTLVSWGDYGYSSQFAVPDGLSNVVQIAGGLDFSLALTYSPPPPLPPPTNDLCANAFEIVLGVTYSESIANATSAGDPNPGCLGGVQAKGVWYKITPSDTGTLTIDTCGSDFSTVLAAYSGGCGSLHSEGCNDLGTCTQISFDVTANTTYWILAGGFGSENGYLHIHATECVKPRLNSITVSDPSVEANGIHITFCATSGESGDTFSWSVSNGVPIITTSGQGTSCFTVVVPETNNVPVGVNVLVSNHCGNDPGGPGGTSGDTCTFCLSRGTPNVFSGTTGSGTTLTASGTCLPLSANTRWYRMLAYDTGLVTVSAEGSSNVNQIAVCQGPSLNSLTNITCVIKPQTRLTFGAVVNNAYWFAVDPGTNSPSTLRVASGFEPTIQSVGMTNGVFELLSTIAPPTTYQVLASTNPALPFSNWSVVFTTNWNSNYPVSDFHIDFQDTNLGNPRQKFYRLAPGP